LRFFNPIDEARAVDRAFHFEVHINRKAFLMAGVALASTFASASGAVTSWPQPIPVVGSPPSRLNVLIEGQSNAGFFLLYGSGALRSRTNYLLGFDGIHQSVNIIGGPRTTAWAGTSLVPDASIAPSSTWLSGTYPNWTDGPLETKFLGYLRALAPAIKAQPTAIVWLHNENDSENTGLTQAAWMSAISYNVMEVRAALAQPPATTPVDFVYVPFDYAPGNLQATGRSQEVQTLKAGFEALTATPSV
jgi:hypothetical protein